MYFARLIDDKI